MKQKRAYFFSVPPTTAYRRYRQHNRPNEATYRDLFDSIPFFDETSDTASESQQGLIKIASNATAISRTYLASGQVMTAARPHQLPLMVGGDDTVADTIDTPVAEGGVKLTPIYDSNSRRMDFKIEFDPDNLSDGTPVFTDKMVFIDADDDLPYLCTISEIVGASLIWQESGENIISPITGTQLDMEDGTIECGDIILDSTGNRSLGIEGTALTTYKLTIHGSNGTGINAGDVVLRGGNASSTDIGGDVFVYGGATVGGTEGNIYIGYTEGGSAQGKVAIGGHVDASFDLKIHHDTYIDGDLRLNITAVNEAVYILGYDTDGDVVIRTALEVMEYLVGTPAQGDIAYYTGAAWALLTDPGADALLAFDDGTSLPVWDTDAVDADKYVAVDAAATAGYLYAAGAGVLRLSTNGGIGITDSGDYIEVYSDVDDLSTWVGAKGSADVSFPRNGYIAVTDESDNTKKIKLSTIAGSKDSSGWMELTPITDFTTTAPTTSRLMTTDLTGILEAGMPVRFKVSTDPAYHYAVIKDITATYIDIMGDTFITAAAGITEFYAGDKGKAFTQKYLINTSAYNASTTSQVLEDIEKMKEGDYWVKGAAKCVGFAVIHESDDTTVQPIVNVRIGSTGTDYISTSNSNKGILIATSWAVTGVDIDTSKNDVEFLDKIEVKVDKNGGTGDAANLTVVVMFVEK